MRERDAERRAERRAEIQNNPEALEEERERMRVKYYSSVFNKIRKDMLETLTLPDTNEPFRQFIRSVLDAKLHIHLSMKSWLNIKTMYANYPLQNTIVNRVENGIEALRRSHEITPPDSDYETEEETDQSESDKGGKTESDL